MGLLDAFSRIKDPVRGTAQVVSTTYPPRDATSANCHMHLVVTVPGVPSFTVDEQFMVKVKKWPSPGDVLPIDASQSEPTKFKIKWDEVSTGGEQAAAQAQQIAARMNQQTGLTGAPLGGPMSGVPGQPTVMVDGRAATPEEVQQYEAMTGMDLDGDGRIAGGAAAGAAAPGVGGQPDAATDRVAALERLVALKASGALTDAEFDAEKARILDS